MSIRLRLTLWYTAVLGVTVIACSAAIYVFVSYVLYSVEKREMQSLANRVVEDISVRENRSLFFGSRMTLELPELNEFRYSRYYVQVVDQEGQIRDRNASVNLPVPEEALRQEGFQKSFFQEQRIESYVFLIHNYPLIIDSTAEGGLQYVGLLQVATMVNDIEQTLASLRTILTLVGLTALVLASTLGWFLAKKALQPIELVIGAAERIGQAQDLHHRIPYEGPQDEIGRLTDTVNGMLGRIQLAYQELEEVIRAQRRFVSDASHELRTPLTTIRGNAELLERMWHRLQSDANTDVSGPFVEAVRDIADEAERMSQQVNDLLALARADAGRTMEKQPIALLPLVEEVARKAKLLPRSAAWIMGDLLPLEGARVSGDGDLLRQLLFIFIENAFKYTPTGAVEMSAIHDNDRNNIGIRIRDTGIGMDKEDVPHIFERFYRADKSRGETAGTGLGLAIARWIIDEHEGSIEVLTKKGEGSSFIIWLPLIYASDTQFAYNQKKGSDTTNGSH
jgi:two-component system OmpR family sensor kinase